MGRTDPEIQTLNSQIRLQQQSTPKSGVKRKVEETSPLDTPAKKDRILSPHGDSSPWSGSVLSPLGEDWLPVTRRRKSAPTSKTPTISFNHKPLTAGPTHMGPPNQQNKAPELAGTSVGSKQTSTEKQNKTNAVDPQPTKSESPIQSTVGPINNKPTKDMPNQSNESKFDEMQNQTNKAKTRNLTQTLSFESIFIPFSLAAKTCFPTQLIEKTVYNFRDYLGPQNCHEYYSPQFGMGPTIEIAKHMLEKAKNFTMQGVDLIYQFKSRSPDYHAKHSYRPKPFKTSKGLVKGSNLKYDNNEIKN